MGILQRRTLCKQYIDIKKWKFGLTIFFTFFITSTIYCQTITVSGATTFCEGGSVTLTAPAGSAYQWYNNNNPISSATNRNYVAITSGSYTVTFTAGGTQTTAIVVTVNPKPIVTFTFTNNVCSGTPVQFTSTVTSGTAFYICLAVW